MNLIKKCLNRVFVEGLSGMALGLFATLIIGTIIQQIGTLAGGSIGTLIYAVGKMAAGLTCAGIGVGVAYKFQESPMVVLSAATSGMIGGYASKVLAGTLLVDGNLALQGPGEPLGAFIAAYEVLKSVIWLQEKQGWTLFWFRCFLLVRALPWVFWWGLPFLLL